MANTKSKITITISNEVNEKLEEIMAVTLAPKSALINNILEKCLESENISDIYKGSIQ